MIELHSCSYFCERPACIKTQRDEMRDNLTCDARLQEQIDNGTRLLEAADGWKESAQYFQQERNELERELAALKRGEFICQKCSLRKDGEHDTKHEF